MEVNVLAFGIAKDIFGGTSLFVNLPDDADTVQLKHVLEERFPRLKLIASYLVAVNNEYANDDLLLSESDEIAIIPPVSGG